VFVENVRPFCFRNVVVVDFCNNCSYVYALIAGNFKKQFEKERRLTEFGCDFKQKPRKAGRFGTCSSHLNVPYVKGFQGQNLTEFSWDCSTYGIRFQGQKLTAFSRDRISKTIRTKIDDFKKIGQETLFPRQFVD
jgi:hypothetical protein